MGASSASDCVTLQDGPVKAAPSGRVFDGASVTLDSPALPGGFRQLSDEAPLRLDQLAGRSQRHARPGRRSHGPSAHRQAAAQHITSGPASQAGNCQGHVDTKTATTVGRERRVWRLRPAHPARLQPPRRGRRRRGPGPAGRPGPGDRRRHGPRRSRSCVLMATPGPRSAHGPASAGRPHSSAGAHLDPAARPSRPHHPVPAACPIRQPIRVLAVTREDLHTSADLGTGRSGPVRSRPPKQRVVS
jgi:hypothetical protein